MRNALLIAFALVLVAGAAVAAWAVLADSDASRPQAPCASNAGAPAQPAVPAGPLAFDSTRDPASRLVAIEKLDASSSDDATLRQAILTDPDEAVRLKALEKAVALAAGESPESRARLLRTVLGGTTGNVKAAALKAAREYPAPQLEADLLKLVESRDEYAPMALNALAYLGTPAAKACILEIARAEAAGNPAAEALRLRAVTLLGVTKDPEGYELLIALANGSDENLRRTATEVLKLYDNG